MDFLKLKKNPSRSGRRELPSVIRTRAAAIAVKLAEKRGSKTPNREELSRAIAIATSMAQSRGEVRPHSQRQTRLGSRVGRKLEKKPEYAARERAYERGLSRARRAR